MPFGEQYQSTFGTDDDAEVPGVALSLVIATPVRASLAGQNEVLHNVLAIGGWLADVFAPTFFTGLCAGVN